MIGSSATDGDTMRTPENSRLRLWGVDAPELKQPGYRSDMSTIDVGLLSRDALAAMLASGTPTAGAPQGQSYGRTVAPVSIGGPFGTQTDAGEWMARTGNATVAPEYLSDDPQRNFDYLQAERLARQNRLGVHGSYVQPPADYRADPKGVVERETVAQFFDTPTPLAGMRPEAEQGFFALLNDPNATAQEVVDFAKNSGGFVVSLADVKRAKETAAKTGQQISMSYLKPPMPMTDLGGNAGDAYARGIGSGFLAGGLDEAGAFVDMIGLTPGRENIWNSDRRLADQWANNREQNASILAHDDYAHPYATTAGEFTGALAGPFQKARTAKELALVGGGYAAAEGFLGTEGDVWERAKGGLIQAPVGVAIGVAGGKALDAVSPYVGRVADYAVGRSKQALAALRGAPKLADDIPPPPPGFTVDAMEVAPPVGDGVLANAPRLGDDVPPPPPGFTLDAQDPMLMRAEGLGDDTVSEALPRTRDYLWPDEAARPASQPMSEAQLRAVAQNITPQELMPVPSNAIESVEEAAQAQAGRYTPSRPVNERSVLERRNIRNWRGQEVAKVGPLDMVGYLRTQGGLIDQGGELAHMGLTNKARRGMDFVGQEARFGPLLNNTDGMTLDEAAHRAWEAGYFPDHTERPDVNDFLDALRSTHEGRQRNWLADDYAQLDNYSAAQADRLGLEQRLREGPVYDDRSYSPDEPAPLPPVQAYEEWGSNAPDFAGNVNLGKLNDPQGINRILAQTERRVGFDSATRGRITQAETERLAGELGMTADDLLKRRKGSALNAEEALAARQILGKSRDELGKFLRKVAAIDTPGDEIMAEFRTKFLRHVAIQEQIAGAAAEAGRSLAQFRMVADSRMVKGDVLSAIVRGGGGSGSLKEAAETLLETLETAPGKFNVVARDLAKPTWRNRVQEYYINMLLSGPQTHMVNMASNTLTAMAQIPEHMLAGVIGKGRQVLARRELDRITGTEIGARSFGLLQGAKEGAKMFARALRTGEPSDFASKVEGDEFKAIPGKLGEFIRIPTRLLTAEDELFKGIARRMELNGMAVRIANREGLKGEAAKSRIAELTANPTDEMYERALDYGRYLTFQRPLEGFANDVSRATNRSMIAKTFLPFVRTPTNLIKFAAERSPAGILMKSWRDELRAGGARRDLAIAKMALGTGFGAAIYEAAVNGQITGAAPSDAGKARLWYADGNQPYSVKLGDNWYSYNRLDPFATTLGVAADLATLSDGMSESEKESQISIFVASIIGNLANKTWLSGISDVVAALDEPGRYSDNLIKRVAGSYTVPALSAQTARYVDPVRRETETISDAVINRIPGLSKGLPSRLDVWGNPLVNDGSLGPDYLSPIWHSFQKNDPVNLELMKADVGVSLPKQGDMSDADYRRYQIQAGQLTHSLLRDVVTSSEWRNLSPGEREDLARGIIRKTRKLVKNDIERRSSELESDPPAKASPLDEAGGLDYHADVQRLIPGVGITSGYRSEEYQEDMRRRGYSPADNSGHLSGSSLDLTPPAGKSMGWLENQTRTLYPGAYVLNEGDHVHVTFPGYYGAPVLGGAKAAGVVNPNDGIPALPAGFTLEAR